MKQDRYPIVGDLIVQKSDGREYFGCVYNKTMDKYGERVYIVWSEPPPDYQPQHGYSATNIHNLRKTFDVIKDS